MLEISLGGRLLVAKLLALAILQPWTSKLAAGSEKDGDWLTGRVRNSSRIWPLWAIGTHNSQFSGSRMRAGLCLWVSSAPCPFLLPALPGSVPSCGVGVPSAAQCCPVPWASPSPLASVSQQVAECCSPLSSARCGEGSMSGRCRDWDSIFY